MPLPLLIPLAALALSAASSGYGIIKGNQDKKKAQAQLDADRAAQAALQTPSTINEQLNDARAQNGALNPALLGMYQQALQGQQNAASFAQRNASSGAQALTAAAQAQNQTQSALPQIAQMQTGYALQNKANLIDALKTSADADYRKQADAQERNQAAQQYSLGLIGAANANRAQAINAGVATIGSALNYAGQMQTQPKVPEMPTATTPSALPITAIATQSTGAPIGMLAPSNYSNLTPLQRLYLGSKAGYSFNPYSF